MPFREPVDWRGLGLYDYPQVISKPMDLLTVKQTIEKNGYKSINDCADDARPPRPTRSPRRRRARRAAARGASGARRASTRRARARADACARLPPRARRARADPLAPQIRLIWNNCKKYNQDGSDFYNLADSFSKKFEDKFSKLKAENPAMDEVEADHAPSLDEKTKFSHNIYRIKQEELGVLVEKLDAKCPEAIDKSTSDDEIEINIDAIDPRTFHDLDRYVRQCLAQSNPKKKKQAGAGGPAPKKAKA